MGYTHNLRQRLEEHSRGKSYWTRLHGPVKLIYYEACLDENDAKQRERYFKSTIGRRFLTKRLRGYYHKAFAL